MATLGDMLREARETRGLTAEDVERATRIRARYVHALEDHQFQELPGDVYTRGFLRNYAIFLDLPVADVLGAYDTATLPPRGRGLLGGGGAVGPPIPALSAPSLKAPTVRSSGAAAREGVPRIQPVSPVPVDTRLRYAPSCTVVSGLGVVLLLAFYLIYSTYTTSQRALPTPTPPPPTPTTLAQILPTVIVSQTPVWTPLPTPGPSPIPSPPAPSPGEASPIAPPGTTPGAPPVTAVAVAPTNTPVPQNVTVEITLSGQPVWFRVFVDGVRAIEGTLPARTVRSWTGTKSIQIRTGRADIVRIKVNGVDRGLLGSSRQTVITKEWDINGNETIIR
jgi:cytoskeletal protein RodZ